MPHPDPEPYLFERVNDFTISTKLLLEAGHVLPALVVLYATIDILGSLLRPESETGTKGQYFKKWADDYMIGPSQFAFTSEDLWAARCGLLHTHTASSDLSRHGKAQQLHYFRSHPPQLPLPTTMRQLQGKLFVDVDTLYAAFEKGTHRFLAAIQRDETLKKRVLHHSSNFFGRYLL